MRSAALACALACAFVVGLLGLAACGSKGGGAMCGGETLGEGMPGGCRAARQLLVCPVENGLSCGCVTNEQSCPECPSFRGTACFNACGKHEYAVECGTSGADAGPVVVYDDPPPGCQLIAQGSLAAAAYCCPCE